MCGLLGAFSKHTTPDIDKRLQGGLQALSYRGPDDKGSISFSVAGGQLALGHTRLSVIDLSTGGHQPMCSTDGRYHIVFNGEIYNYRELRQELKGFGHSFKTDSDTEVLLAAWAQWDVSVLRRLMGMFAFAVYDRQDHVLTLIRDGFGIKPLFYQQNTESFCFASEIPAMLALTDKVTRLNLERAYEYLVFGSYDNGVDTFYEGIYHLAPGHLLRIDLKSLHVKAPERWWWPSIAERSDLSFDDAAAQLRERFLENIRLHLRSDVPIGAALSGGIDSSAVVCAMRYLESEMPIHTFTFVAPGTGVNEEYWADIVNNHISAIPHKVFVTPEELGQDLDDLIKAQGEPFTSTSIYAQYRTFKLARDEGIKVTLDGQGADELLAGYSGYPEAYLLSLIDKREYSQMFGFLEGWAQWPGRGRRKALRLLASATTPRLLRALARRYAGQVPAPSWLRGDWLLNQKVEVQFPPVPAATADGKGRRLAEQLRSALTGHGLAQLLRHGDRGSMRWSIESRVPFLTTDLAEFLLTMPESYLLSSKGETKCIFRAAMRGIVPDQILDRRDKIGFQTPEHNWLRHQGTRIQEWIGEADALPFLNGYACRTEVNRFLDGKKQFSPQLWRLINYCRWAQLHS